MTEPQVRQIYAKQGDTGRVLDITLDQTPEDGTLRILRPDGVEVTSEAVTGGEVESGSSFESLTEADVTELSVGIEPVQDLSHGDPSPTNICPITGHDEVRVYFGAEQGTAGSTYTTSLGQTVYGGTLDMVTGQLVVDKAMVDMGSLTWLLNSSLNGKPAFYVRLNDAKTVSASSVADMTTSCYSVISADNLYLQKDNTGIIALNGQNYLQVRDTRYSTASDYKSGITGQQLVYELATPLTYTLTPQQIKTLVGTNNVWASSGQIVNIKFTYGGLLSELPSEATEIVGKCYCDIEQNGVSSMPFTLNIKKNERQ